MKHKGKGTHKFYPCNHPRTPENTFTRPEKRNTPRGQTTTVTSRCKECVRRLRRKWIAARRKESSIT